MPTSVRRFAFLTPLLLAACTQMVPQDQAMQREQALQNSLDQLKSYQLELESENAALRAQNRNLQVQVESSKAASARNASAEIDQAFAQLDEYMKRLGMSGGDGDVTWFQGPEGPVVRIQDQILFRSGSHNVSNEGKALLAKLAPELAGSGAFLRVEGHTDSDPVRLNADKYPHGNLDLSAERALEVAAILIENGVPSDRVALGGYGEFRPVAANDTPESKRKNRRVEIVLLQQRPAGLTH